MLVDTPATMKLKGFEHGYTQGTFLWVVNNLNFQYQEHFRLPETNR